jgi:Ataxin-3
VFAIVQTDPQAPLALNRTEADEVASTLPEPAHSSSTVPHLSTAQKSSDNASESSLRPTEGVEGFEDEDMELQAALQASLMGGAAIDFSLPLPRGSSSGQQTGTRTPTQRSLPPMAAHPPAELQSLPLLGFPRPQQQADDPDDPVAASMARNRAIMDRMRREQEMALREQYEEEAARIHGAGADVSLGADTGISTRTRRARRTRADEEEEDMIRRAIEESRANSGSSSSSPVIVDDDEEAAEVDDGMMIVSDDEDEEYRPQVTRIPPPVPAPAPGAHVSALSYPSHRVYDDDDAELQAALKASLESVPDGFTIPDPPPLPVAPPPTSVSTPGTSSMSTRSSERGTEDDEVASQASIETSQVQEPQVSVDEMRRRRLARFGG